MRVLITLGGKKEGFVGGGKGEGREGGEIEVSVLGTLGRER